jgi:UDP-N-acetylglucosamine 2-epimerase (non-hydrolysing)
VSINHCSIEALTVVLVTQTPFEVVVAAGTRPEIVKLAPLLNELERQRITTELILTGQHHSEAMMGAHLARCTTRPADVWQLEGTEGDRVGALLANAFAFFAQRRPSVVVVQGDTYTVPLIAMAARRYGVPVAHVEAGLRSHNLRSQEECNRTVAAALATVHYAPTAVSAANLVGEGIDQRSIQVVGNTICDTLRLAGHERTPLNDRFGVVVTVHRASTVDNSERLAAVVSLIKQLAHDFGPVTFPMHPRTLDRLNAFGLRDQLAHPNLHIVEPLDHPSMLHLLAHATLAVTDSGGLQEETSWLGVPVVVLRNSSPRPEGVAVGQAALVGLNVNAALMAAERMLTDIEQVRINDLVCPYGDGHASERIVRHLVAQHDADALRLQEPAQPVQPDAPPSSTLVGAHL